MEVFDTNISDIRFIAFDTETTGIQSDDEIVEIAGLAFDEEFEHRAFETLVRPVKIIPDFVVAIHGISQEMVVSAPSGLEALRRYFDFLSLSGSPRVLIAHNAGFDVDMIHRHGASEFNSFPQEIVLDTCMLAKALYPELKTHKLQSLVEFFKIEVTQKHRALADVRALKAVFIKLLEKASDLLNEMKLPLTVGSLVELCCGYFLLAPGSPQVRKKPFCIPPRVQRLEELCGKGLAIRIAYDSEDDLRYVTPVSIKIKGFKVFLEAHCHRDDIKKTFRIDKIKGLQLS